MDSGAHHFGYTGIRISKPVFIIALTSHFILNAFKGDDICLVGVGSGEAYILIEYRLVLGYSLVKNDWKHGTLPPSNYIWKIHQNACIFLQKKNYERYDLF